MIFEQKTAKVAKRAGNGRFSQAPSLPLLPSIAILFALLLFPLCVRAEPAAWAGLWFTPDQQGQRHFERGEFAEAAADFRDPLWQGAAWYRAGEFDKAAQAFARRDTAEAHYNEGNARLMLGKYEAAIACYTQALEKRPDWKEAAENRAIATARAKALDSKSGDMTGGMLGADEIVFDNKAGTNGQKTEIAGGEALSDREIQALWLRRVQTRPADFLKAKFAYQLQEQKETQ